MIGMVKKVAILAFLAAMLMPGLTSAADQHHFKVVSFQVRDAGAQPEYAASFNGDLIQLIHSVDATSEPFVLVHTPHIHPGDIVNLQADILGAGEGSKLEDDGMNCQLSYNHDGSGFTIGGLCSFFVTAQSGEAEKRNVVIAPQTIEPSDEKNGHWVLLFDDRQSGVVFYAGIER